MSNSCVVIKISTDRLSKALTTGSEHAEKTMAVECLLAFLLITTILVCILFHHTAAFSR